MASLLILSVLGYGIFLFKTNRSKINLPGSSEPLRLIHFETDGVLNRQWFAQEFYLVKGLKLMDLDIHEIKKDLEKHGQVKEATVTRKFPDELHITVRERIPVLRARLATTIGGKPEERLISREGVVYMGIEYSRSTLEELPYLGGVRFSIGPDGIEPVEGLPELARLLTLARTRFPAIYKGWKVVSLHDSGDATGVEGTVITVKSRKVKSVIFSPPDFDRQLGQLEQIIAHSKQRGIRVIKKIDLSLGDQVVVQDFPDLRHKRLRN